MAGRRTFVARRPFIGRFEVVVPGSDPSPGAVGHAAILTTPIYRAMPDGDAVPGTGAAASVAPIVRPPRPGTGPTLPPRRPAAPRDQLSGLLSTVAHVSDEVLFEDAQNALSKLFPRLETGPAPV